MKINSWSEAYTKTFHGRSILPLRVKTPVYSVTTLGIHQVYTPLYTTVHLYTPLKYSGVYTYVYTSLITPVMTLYTVYTPIIQVYSGVFGGVYIAVQAVSGCPAIQVSWQCQDSGVQVYNVVYIHQLTVSSDRHIIRPTNIIVESKKYLHDIVREHHLLEMLNGCHPFAWPVS